MICSVCRQPFAPEQLPTDPATEAGQFLTREFYRDGASLCPRCLASRGLLGMMYCREFD